MTTAEIARRAGVSEGTLFTRFGSKEDLFEQALGLTEYGAWRTELLALVGQGDVRRNLERALLSYLDSVQELVQALALIFSRGYHPSHNPLLERLDNPVGHDIQALADYLRAEADLGRLRPLDAEVAALAMLGALGQLVSLQLHRQWRSDCPEQGFEIPEQGRFVRGIMDLWWPGLAP